MSKAAKLKQKKGLGGTTKIRGGRGRKIGQVLPEDQAWVNTVHRLRPQPEKTVGPIANSSEKVSRRDVERRVMNAMMTIRALPDRERRFFIVKSSSPEYIQDYMGAYSSVEELAPIFQPTPEDVSDCLTALSWVRHLKKDQWKLLWWRSFELSFGLIAKYIGRSDETARKRYQEALTDAWTAANGIGG